MKKSLMLLVLLVFLLVYGCGSSSDNSSNDPDTPATPSSAVQASGNALLGPLSGAKVDVYCPDNMSNAIFSDNTTVYDPDADNYGKTGKFMFKTEFSCEYYLVEVSGGTDIDPDDDGFVVPEEMVANKGSIRGILFQDNNNDNVTINPLTEIAYRKLESRLETGYDNVSELQNDLNVLARAMLSDDLNGDGEINKNDLLDFDPINDKPYFKSKIFGDDYSSLLPDNDESNITFIESIHDNVTFDVDTVMSDEGSDRLTKIYYMDRDGDGFGSKKDIYVGYERPLGHLLNNDDPLDNDSSVFPGSIKWETYLNDTVSFQKIDDNNSLLLKTSYSKIYTVNLLDGRSELLFSPPEILETIGDNFMPLVFTDNGIYLTYQTYESVNNINVYALNNDGSVEWNFKNEGRSPTTPVVNEGSVYGVFKDYSVWDNFTVYSLDSAGNMKWSFEEKGNNTPYPVIGDGSLYVSRYHNYYESLTGSYIYRCNLYSLDTDSGLQNWDFGKSECYNISTPVVENDTIYVTMNDRTTDNVTLYALNSATGVVNWSFEENGDRNYFTMDNDTVYISFGTWDNSTLYAFDKNGESKWNLFMEDYPTSLNTYEDGTIYIMSSLNDIYVLNPDGTKKFVFKSTVPVSEPVIGNDGIYYIASSSGNIYALNPDGSIYWSFYTGSSISIAPVMDDNGILYIITGSGTSMRKVGSVQSDTKTLSVAPVETEESTIYGIYTGSERSIDNTNMQFISLREFAN